MIETIFTVCGVVIAVSFTIVVITAFFVACKEMLGL